MLRAFRDLRISIKALLPLVLLSLVGLGVGGLIGRAMMTTDTHYSELLEQQNRAALHSARLDSITLNLGRALWRAIALPEADNVALSVREIDGMEAAAAAEAGTMRKAMEGTVFVATIGDLEREFQTIRAAALRSLRTLQAGQTEDAVKIVRAEIIVPFGKLREATTRLTATLVAASDARSAALTDETHAAVRTSLLSLGLGIVLSLGFGIWLTRAAILRPFARLDHAMQRLAGGDLTVEVADTDRRDEVGRMAQALQGFAVGLREATSLRGEQETLKLRAEEDRKSALLALAGNLESSVGGVVDGIASAASELTAAATSMVGIAEATSGRAGTVSSATAIASGNVGTVAAATEELAASVAEISRQVSDSARMAAGAVDQANRTNTTVANLTEAAAKIGEVTRLIGDIAAQTNLLALNATIEAARAGEAGKGFAVVASEVKALANQTAQATGSIATQIQAMQAATRDAASDIGAIRDSIGQINQVTAAIAAAVEEQGAATRDIAENVQRAAVGTSEIASAIDGVTSAAAETGGAAGQVQATSAILAQQAETLRLEVGNFLGRVRAA